MKLKLALTVALLATVASCEENLRWGRIGHSISGHIAQMFLNPAAAAAVQQLIPEHNGQLSQIASWADEVRNQYPWASNLHFINTPDWLCNYQYARDCKADRCCDGAIQNYTARLENRQLSANQRTEALKFLVHFIGDVHQPLHVGFTSDLGGNRITGKFFNKSTNLHALWDTGMLTQRIKEFGGDEYKYVQYLKSQVQGPWAPQLPAWRQCWSGQPYGACSTNWADEAIKLACSNAYVDVDGTKLATPFNLDTAYLKRNVGAFELALARAGVRMANVLNNVLGNQNVNTRSLREVMQAARTHGATM